jgi:hypothetical protein
MGADDRTERQTKAQETAQMDELRETIAELERQVGLANAQLEAEKVAAARHAEDLASDYQHLALAKEHLAAERARTADLEERLQDVQERCDLLKEQYQQTVVVATAASSASHLGSMSRSVDVADDATASSPTPVPTANKTATPLPVAAPEVKAVVPPPPAAEETALADAKAANLDSGKLDSVTSMRAKKLGATGMLHKQAELRDCIAMLRRENGDITSQLSDMQHSLALSEDQVQALKSSIRDLEATLQREREFSAANRAINVEYLVNILRKFLLAANPAERAKLVPILCQILHLRGDDAKAINDKWQVRGIVGWFQQTKANSKGAGVLDDFEGDKSLGTGVANMDTSPVKKKREIKVSEVVSFNDI